MTQAVWSTAHGHPLAVTDLHGRQISRLGAHVDPILVLFAPLWRLWPSPSMLLTVQAAAIALGALPVFWLARARLRSDRAALGFALAYLLLPAVQWLTLNEFHPVALACPLLLLAFWYLHEERLVAFGAAALAAAACKEEIPLVLAGFGLWYAVAKGRRLAGTGIALAGVGAFALAVVVIIPHFNDGSGSSFYARYEEVGGSPGGILREALHHPWALVGEAFDGRGVVYLLELLLPVAALPLAAPLVLAAAVPELGLNLLSSTRTQTSIHFHYTAGAIPPLVAAAVLGASRLAVRRARLAVTLGTIALLAALASNFLLGAVPLWQHLPGGERYGAHKVDVSARDRVARRALRLIPAGAVVSSSNSLGAHLSARRRILSFPRIEDATWVAADESEGSFGDRIAPLAAARRLVRLRQNPAFRLVFQQDGILVFRRTTS